MSTSNPAEVMALSYNIKNVDEKIWSECWDEVMKTGLVNKFSQNDKHKKFSNKYR
jgi:predicted NAD-dependent protein-ADP-ribosyltransferase YbiA (DUF1768 family)